MIIKLKNDCPQLKKNLKTQQQFIRQYLQLNMRMQEQEMEYDFDSKAPQAFICPITNTVMQNPYIDDNGISYQKQAIFGWVNRTGRHPTAGRQMKIQQLKANLMLKDAINQYKRQFQDRRLYQSSRKKFEVDRLNFQAATILQMNQLQSTPDFQDTERNYKLIIQQLQQIVEDKQKALQRLRNTDIQKSRKLQMQGLQIQRLEEALEKSKERENQMKTQSRQIQQQLMQTKIKLTDALQQLSFKKRNLESENQMWKKNEKVLEDKLELQRQQKQVLKQELLIAQFKLKKQQKCYNQQQPKAQYQPYQTYEAEQLKRHFNSQIMRVKIAPDTESRAFQLNGYKLDNENKNVCIKNSSCQYWLCSSALPLDGEFVFTIKVTRLTFNIRIGVMESKSKGQKLEDTSNHCVYLFPRKQIRRPNEEQTNSQAIKCFGQQLPDDPFLIECHVNRQQNTIAWYYKGIKQTKCTLPKAWKTQRRQLCAVFWLFTQGNSIQMM